MPPPAPSPMAGRKGWYPNGCPMDGTRFKISEQWPVFYRKDDKVFWIDTDDSNKYKGWREEGIMFNGDRRTNHKDWLGLATSPIDE